MTDIVEKLNANGINLYLENYSALDKYFDIKNTGIYYLLTDASLVSLAGVLEDIEYPGHYYIDASLEDSENRYYFRCVDHVSCFPSLPFTAQNFLYNIKDDSYLDPYGVYRDLRRPGLVEADNHEYSWFTVMEASKLVSRYHYDIDENSLKNEKISTGHEPSHLDLKELLITVLTGSNADRGLELLNKTRFIGEFFPELSAMQNIEHSKEYHPEGNVWEHTLEALKHRKNNDFTLSMALLLHDLGKTASSGSREKPFLEHAEIGTKIARPFLRRLGFSRNFIEDVMFLIKYHMLPAAMGELPVYRMESALKNPLFPLLLELYRADTSATFRGRAVAKATPPPIP